VRRPLLAAAAAAAALLLPAAAHAVTLVGTVNGDMTISLTLDGAPVTNIAPGTYTLEIHDNTDAHNFHFQGPGVDEFSLVGDVGTFTRTVTLQAGFYTFFCDVHPTSMFGRFSVGNALQVTKGGDGQGTVTSSPAGINCGGTCQLTFGSPTMVTLTATPAAGSHFDGWSGEGCGGTGQCVVNVDQGRAVNAVFTKTTTGPGTGGLPPGPPATLIRLAVSKLNGVRYVTLTLQVSRRTTARGQILRRTRSLASARATVSPGRRKLKIRVPRAVKAGSYTMKLTLTEGGRSFVVRRTVRLRS
jgi:plastocyanin